MSGIYDANTLMEMYRTATEEPFSFMFIRLDAKTRRDMFWLRFEARLLPESSEDINDGDAERLVDGGGANEQIRKPRPKA